MNTKLSIHNIKHIELKPIETGSEREVCNWRDIVIKDNSGSTFELTIFAESRKLLEIESRSES